MTCLVGLIGYLESARSQPVPAASGPTVSGVTAVSADRFALGEGYVRLPYGVSSGETTLILSADQLSKEAMAAPTMTISDLQTAAKSRVARVVFRMDAELSPSATGRRWVVTAVVNDLLVNEEQSRFASIEIAGTKRAIPYVLTNRARAAPEFTVTVNSPWFLSGDNDANTVTVVTGDQAVSGLRLANSTLAEKSVGTPLRTQQLELCRSLNRTCEPPQTIPPLTSETLYLRVTDTARPKGRFTGTLAFASNARPEPKVVTVEVASSTFFARVFGAIAIVVGVFLAWALTVWSRARLDRLSALRPALEARRRILDLLDRLDQAGRAVQIEFAQLRDRYLRMANGLTESELDLARLLPSRWPVVGTAAVSDLRARLQSLEQPIIGLTVVVRDGVEPLWTKWRAPGGGDKPAILAGLKSLDQPNAAATESAAQALVSSAIAIASPAPPGALQGVRTVAPSTATELQRVSVQIDALNIGIWIAYLVLAAIVGSALLVISNPAFGTAMDYVYCLLWGFGLPTTIDKLQQLSPTGISTSVGIALPKL